MGWDDVTAVRKPMDICNVYVPQIDAGRPGTGEDKKKRTHILSNGYMWQEDVSAQQLVFR